MRKPLSLLLIALFLLPMSTQVAFAYQMERPPRTIERIDRRDEKAKVDDEASVGIGVDVATYRDNTSPTEKPYCGRDGVCFNVIGTANTRKGIEYDYTTVPSSPYWFEAATPTGIAGDDSGAWISIPFGVTFYGGPGVQNASGVYDKVWVCSNGFLSFESSSISSVPIPVPYPLQPNALIAPYWADLDPAGGSITYYGDLTRFVVEWKSVLSKYNGERQTFEVVILNDYYPRFRGQNRFFMLYQTVTWAEEGFGNNTTPSYIPPPEPDIPVVQGIEDSEGYKGTEPPNVESGYGFQFTARPVSSPEIRELNLLMNKNDANAQVYVSTEEWNIIGHNVQFQRPGPNASNGDWLGKAVAGGATLLMTAVIGKVYGSAAGFMFGVTRITMESAHEYAKQLWEAKPVKKYDSHDDPGTNFCYVNASAATYAPPYDYPVDASIGTQVFWIFLDDNNLDHELTLTSQLKYYSHDQEKMVTLETSVTLKVYIGTPATPAQPTGSTYGHLGYYYPYSTNTSTPDSDSIYYQFDWDDGSNTTIGPYPSGTGVSASHSWDSTGTYHIKVRAKDSSYGIWSSWSPSLAVTIAFGSGGCPYVSAWNGTHYVLDNNLIPGAERSNGTDVADSYMLQRPLIRRDGKYSLLIWDLDKHSFLDHAELLAVDHESDVNIAVSPYGEIFTYKNPAALIAATDQNGQDVTNILCSAEGDYFEGYAGDHVLLDFGSLDVSKGAKLVLRADGGCELIPCKESIHVQVSKADGEWVNVASFIPRIYWSTDIIDMSNYLPDINGNIKVRLYFTAHHKIDYVGLDTSKQGEFETSYANLATANHSRLGDVKEILVHSDDQRAELLPSESITLEFTLPQNTEEERDFIIVLEGHYFIIG